MIRKCTLPGTDVSVSRIAYGTGSLHRVVSGKERQRLLGYALDAGLTHFDTAPLYGHGLAEFELGRFMLKRRAEITVTTKFGLRPAMGGAKTGVGVLARRGLARVFSSAMKPSTEVSVKAAIASFEGSLRRLRTDFVDFLFLHEPAVSEAEADLLVEWLGDERKRGRIRSFGVAGAKAMVEPLVAAHHPIARVVQTFDCVSSEDADFLAANGRQIQFTYGYISSGRRAGLSVSQVLSRALERNSTGSVVVSALSLEHLSSLAESTSNA